jgi:hypothetical protein
MPRGQARPHVFVRHAAVDTNPQPTKLCEDSGAFETAWLPAASRRSHAQFTVRLRAPSAMGCFRRRWDRVETHVDAQ